MPCWYEPSVSLCSSTASAASRSLIFASSRPQEPTIGLSTTGYPIASMASRADSRVNVTTVFGTGTPSRASAAVVRILSPQMRATFARFTVGTRAAFSSVSAYSDRPWWMDRSRTTPAWGKGLPMANLMRSSSRRSKGITRRRSASNKAFSSTRTREQRMPTISGCVIIQVSVYLCDYNRAGGCTMLALKSKLLEKIDATPVKTAKKVALAYSGGLDSSLCAVLAKEKYQVEQLFAITVDVGQGQDEMDAAIQKAKVLGITPIVIDAKQEFADLWLSRAIQANSNYEGYPVSTSMTRQLFAPQLDVLVPVRDFDLTRGEEEELSKELGIPITEVMQGGDDKTLWCRSLASGAVGLNQPIPDHAWLWLKPPAQASATPTKVSVTFEGGVPVALDGDELPLPEIVSKLNVIAGSHGIGKIDIFEDGIMGLKSRELYEAPAAAVLLKLHHDLEQFTLTKEELDFKAAVDQKWAYLVYHGAWFSPLKQALDAFIQTTQANVNGTLTANLFHGTIDLESRQSDHTLFFPEIRGLQSRSFNQQLCGPAAQIGGLQWEVLAKRMSKGSH